MSGDKTISKCKALCRAFVDFSGEAGLKGRARDVAAFYYFVGAHAMLVAAGSAAEADADHVERFTTFLVATRGFKAVEEYAESGA